MTKEELNLTIGVNVRKYRTLYSVKNNVKLTQNELAKKIGVSTALIGLLESRRTDQSIGIYNLYKISEALNTPIEKFFE